jgi:inorganic pyrophosphatase
MKSKKVTPQGFNPWHQVEYGKNIQEFVGAIIEIPFGSKLKYELNKESGLLKLDGAYIR